jgi:hypothetical protein
MKNPFKIKWLVAGCIWSLTLMLTYWNLNKIDAVIFTREKAEQIRREIIFKAQRAKILNKIRKSHDALFYPVSSVALGIISVDRQVRTLASNNGLYNVDMRSQTNPSTNDQLSCQLSIQGTLKQVFNFLIELSKYQYLSIKHLTIQVSSLDAETKSELEFSFQYRILPHSKAEDSLLHVSNEQFESEKENL